MINHHYYESVNSIIIKNIFQYQDLNCIEITELMKNQFIIR